MAAFVALAATQHLALGFETQPLVGEGTLEHITGWLNRRPVEGAAMLGGLALSAAALAGFVGLLWPNRGPAAITTRRDDGWTRIDRASLAGAIRRRLDDLDPRNRIRTELHRNGRVDLVVTSPESAMEGAGREVPAALAEICEQRNLPCRPGAKTSRRNLVR